MSWLLMKESYKIKLRLEQTASSTRKTGRGRRSSSIRPDRFTHVFQKGFHFLSKEERLNCNLHRGKKQKLLHHVSSFSFFSPTLISSHHINDNVSASWQTTLDFCCNLTVIFLEPSNNSHILRHAIKLKACLSWHWRIVDCVRIPHYPFFFTGTATASAQNNALGLTRWAISTGQMKYKLQLVTQWDEGWIFSACWGTVCGLEPVVCLRVFEGLPNLCRPFGFIFILKMFSQEDLSHQNVSYTQDRMVIKRLA